jgi:hypothetical protein
VACLFTSQGDNLIGDGSDSNGFSTAVGLKGQYTVKATVSGLAGEADFTLTND